MSKHWDNDLMEYDDVRTYCEIYSCDECPRLGDDCNGDSDKIFGEKVEYVEANYSSFGKKELAKRLNISEADVEQRMQNLNEVEQLIIKARFSNMTRDEVAEWTDYSNDKIKVIEASAFYKLKAA